VFERERSSSVKLKVFFKQPSLVETQVVLFAALAIDRVDTIEGLIAPLNQVQSHCPLVALDNFSTPST
jgi:hypothetical protein